MQLLHLHRPIPQEPQLTLDHKQSMAQVITVHVTSKQLK